MEHHGYLFGLDFGLRRIGIAVGQHITQTASPLAILQAHNGHPHWEELTALIQIWKPTAYILGLPLDSRGQPYPLTHAVQHFAQELRARTEQRVILVDEILSTKSARSILKERAVDPYARHARQKRPKKSNPVDSFAACVILEDWLREKRASL